MKRKILTMITIASIFLMALAGCGDSSRRNAAAREAGLYQADGSFIPWDDLGIDVDIDEEAYQGDRSKLEKWPTGVFRDNNYNGELVFPDNITRIGIHAFSNCESLTSIDLSHTQLTDIERNAFSNTSLTSIDLPDTLESIGSAAFANCKSLTNINYAGTKEEWDDIKKDLSWDEGTPWNFDSPIETITCSDGVITL